LPVVSTLVSGGVEDVVLVKVTEPYSENSVVQVSFDALTEIVSVAPPVTDTRIKQLSLDSYRNSDLFDSVLSYFYKNAIFMHRPAANIQKK
jgi:hypothetical protein